MSYLLPASWVSAHLLIFLTIRDSWYRLPIFVFIGSLLLFMYVFKPYTYDLKKYSAYIDTGFIPASSWAYDSVGTIHLSTSDRTGERFIGGEEGYEVGFRTLSKVVYKLIPRGKSLPRIDVKACEELDKEFCTGVLSWRKIRRTDVMLFILVMFGFGGIVFATKNLIGQTSTCTAKKLETRIIWLPLIAGCIFFLLGTQNVLRQFLGAVPIIIALPMILSRRYVTSLALIVFSGCFHKWAPICGSLILLPAFSLSISGSWHRGGRWLGPIFCSRLEAYALILGFLLVIGIKVVAVLDGHNWGIPLVEDIYAYLLHSDELRNEGRWNSWIKIVALLTLFLISESILGRNTEPGGINIRLLRRCTLLLLFPFVIFPEIFSKLLIFYWAVEVIFVLWSVNSLELRARLAGSTIFAAYGFAPNAINIVAASG